tara:strand:- start:395 stop:622 length:228 start_codon:yes stop_codon:yes gene_type:complete
MAQQRDTASTTERIANVIGEATRIAIGFEPSPTASAKIAFGVICSITVAALHLVLNFNFPTNNKNYATAFSASKI